MRDSLIAALGRRGLYLFVLFQCFCVPVVLLGPSWAAWMSLSDLCLFAAAPALLLGAPPARPGPADGVWRGALVLLGLCAVSYAAMTWLDVLGVSPGVDRSIGVNWGLLYLYRMVQALLVMRAAARIDLTPRTAAAFARMAGLAIVLLCVGVVGTYFSLVDPRLFAPHVPDDPGVSGPWFAYKKDFIPGAGTISYNHAYTAVQALLLLVLRLSLAPGASAANLALLAVTFLSVLLSESRAGLAAFAVFAVPTLKSMGMRRTLLAAGLGTALVAGLSLVMLDARQDFFGDLGERYAAILDPTVSENLSDRDSIWENSLAYLNREPYRWILGSGFGSQVGVVGNNAHMTYLQLVVEGGVLGLLAFGLFFREVLGVARGFGQAGRPLLHGTVALLASACTQETFYPVPSLGCFIALYFLAFTLTAKASEGVSPMSDPHGGKS